MELSKFSTFKFYNKRERLGIFYFEHSNKIVIIKCSKHDQFSIKKSKDLLYAVNSKKEEFNIDGKLTQREFMDWCEKKYQKMYSVDIDMNAKVKIIFTSIKHKMRGSVLTLKFLA